MDFSLQPTTGSNALTFGPVIERELPFEQETLLPFLLDFESGRIVTPPGEMSPRNETAQQQWLAQNSVDTMADELTTGPMLVSYEFKCVFKEMESNSWETLRPDTVVADLQTGEGLKEVAETRSPKMLPATFLFKTREGGMGVVQIVGFTDNPHGVKIRYKLVQVAGKFGGTD
jgi:hypothetical protein